MGQTYFNVDMDVYKGRLIDVDEIQATKVARHAMETTQGEASDEGTTRLSPSPTTDLTMDARMTNVKDATKD